MVIAMSSCSGSRNESSGFCNVDGDGWSYGDVMTFNPCHDDSIAVGDIVVMLRHGNDYLYRNLWLEVTTEDDDVTRTDTVNIEMCDVYGDWYGGGIGARFQLADTVLRHVRHRSGSPVRVRHIMRVDTLRGIEQVGVAFID